MGMFKEPKWYQLWGSTWLYSRLRVTNDTVRVSGAMPLPSTCLVVTSLAFGGVHSVAWNFEFLTDTEMLLWRAASIASTLLPLAIALVEPALRFGLTQYFNGVSLARLRRHLRPLLDYPSTYWEILFNHPLKHHGTDLKMGYKCGLDLVCQSPGQRTWNFDDLQSNLSYCSVRTRPETNRAGRLVKPESRKLWTRRNIAQIYKILEHALSIVRGSNDASLLSFIWWLVAVRSGCGHSCIR
jgi:hypothetical protein